MDHSSAHTQKTLPAGWECAFDHASGHWYYFNRSTGATSWVAPQPDASQSSAIPIGPQYVAATAVAATAAASAAAEAPAATKAAPSTATASAADAPEPAAAASTEPSTVTTPAAASAATLAAAAPGAGPSSARPTRGSGSGWYYRDRSGTLQGPFQQDHLRAWRAFLPMDLRVWYVELQPPRQQQQELKQERPQEAAEQGPASAPVEAAAVRVGAAEMEARGQEGPSTAAGGASGEEPAAAAERDGTVTGTGPGHEGSGAGDGEEAPGEVTAGSDKDAGGAAAGDGIPSCKRDNDAGNGDTGSGGKDVGAVEPPPAKRARTAVQAPAAGPTDGSERTLSPSPSATPGSEDADGDTDVADGTDGPAGGSGGGFATAEEAIACGLPAIELAELLGDGALLADWRRRFPGHRPPGTAPPAQVHDHWLRAAAAAAASAHAYGTGYGHHYGAQHAHAHTPAHSAAGAGDAGGDGAGGRPRSREESMLEYAEAVLAVLPPDDEAVVLARQAAAAGKSLADVVNFSWGASASTSWGSAGQHGGYDGGGAAAVTFAAGTTTTSAVGAVDEHGVPTEYVRDPRSGRLTAVGRDAPPASTAWTLYGEYGGWVNPEQIEDYLAEAKRWRQEQLPALWARKKLKEQREAKAKKAARVAGGGL